MKTKEVVYSYLKQSGHPVTAISSEKGIKDVVPAEVGI